MGCGAKTENGRRRTSHVHVCTYQSYIIILNCTSLGWLTYLVNNLVSGVDPSHAHSLPSHTLALHLCPACFGGLGASWQMPEKPQLHPSIPVLSPPPKKICHWLIPVVSLLWSQPSTVTKDKGWAGQSTPSHFLLMKALKPPKLGAATLLWPGATWQPWVSR